MFTINLCGGIDQAQDSMMTPGTTQTAITISEDLANYWMQGTATMKTFEVLLGQAAKRTACPLLCSIAIQSNRKL